MSPKAARVLLHIADRSSSAPATTAAAAAAAATAAVGTAADAGEGVLLYFSAEAAFACSQNKVRFFYLGRR